MSRLWDKGKQLDQRVLEFTAGEDHALDQRLIPYDIRASIAHATMLHQQALLSDDDYAAIRDGLESLADRHSKQALDISLEDEDCHTMLERELTAAIGAAGGRIHLGRSRNDQVLVALRLYMLDAVQVVETRAGDVVNALQRLVERQGEIELPGYTHMQQAMPSSVALWAEGFISEIEDDRRSLQHARSRADRNPLGSAAGYGSPGVNIDRNATTQSLQFGMTHTPVTAVQLSRGKAEAHLVFEMCQLLGDCSRIAADLLLFYTREFGYVALPTDLTTGSSIMPQKRNPDVLELLRAAPATATGALNEILAITHKLTSGYHRDLQRIKAPLFRSIDLAEDCLVILAAMLDGLQFQPDRIQMDAGLYAAERANRLVADEGLPFREAYRRVAAELAES